MTSRIINASPYLRTTRNFPEEAQPLSVEINRSYLDIAEKVNDRTIGFFPVNVPAITGERWFVSKNQRQQTLRQVYNITGAGSIDHGIKTIIGFTAIYGTFTDGTVWYPLPYVDAAAATNQVSVKVTATQIVITAGGGAPAIVSGFIVLEWLSNP